MQQSVPGKGSAVATTDLGTTAPCRGAPSPCPLQKKGDMSEARDFCHWRVSCHFTHIPLAHYCSLLTSKFIRKCSCDTSTVGTDRQWESRVPGIMWGHRVQMSPSDRENTGEQKGMQQEQWDALGSIQIAAGMIWRWRHGFWQEMVLQSSLPWRGNLGMAEQNSRIWQGTG